MSAMFGPSAVRVGGGYTDRGRALAYAASLMILLVQVPLACLCHRAFSEEAHAERALFYVPVLLTGASMLFFSIRLLRRGDLFDLRLAPICALVLFVLPRVIEVHAQLIEFGAYTSPTFGRRLSFGWQDFAFSVHLMALSMLAYMAVCLLLEGLPDCLRRRHTHAPGWRGRSSSGISLVRWTVFGLSVALLLVDLGLKIVSFGGASYALAAASGTGRNNALVGMIGEGALGIFRTISVVLMLGCVLLGPRRQTGWKLLVFGLAVAQCLAALSAGNRQTALFPILGWFIASFIANRWKLNILYLFLPYVLGVIARLMLDLRYGVVSVPSWENPLTQMVALWSAEGSVFDFFVQLVAFQRRGILESGWDVLSTSWRYFVPRFLLAEAKPVSADFRLSVLLGLTSGGMPYGTPPTLFGGLYWYLGTWGPPVGFGGLAGIMTLLQRATSLRKLGASTTVSAYVGRGLSRVVVWISAIDFVRVGVLMRETLTLAIYVGAVLCVSLFAHVVADMTCGGARSGSRKGRQCVVGQHRTPELQ